MHINGCHVVSKLNTRGAEGFETHVTRERIVDSQVDDKNSPQKETSTQGPFFKLADAVAFAHDWNDFDRPPLVPNDAESDCNLNTDVSCQANPSTEQQTEGDLTTK